MNVAEHLPLNFKNNISTAAVLLDIEGVFGKIWHLGSEYNFLFSGFAPCCAQYNNTKQSTTFRNQTLECSPFYYYYTALHVSAYRQAIIKCYLKILYNGQVTEYFLCGSTESRYTRYKCS
jgi:hypothetical protein